MIFDLFRSAGSRDDGDGNVTGTYADGAPPVVETSASRRTMRRTQYERDYGANRTISSVPIGYV